eukprot:2014419-Amphidinium_carterae.1
MGLAALAQIDVGGSCPDLCGLCGCRRYLQTLSLEPKVAFKSNPIHKRYSDDELGPSIWALSWVLRGIEQFNLFKADKNETYAF